MSETTPLLEELQYLSCIFLHDFVVTSKSGELVSYGKFLKQAREQVGLTQVELGERVGVTGAAISNWEAEINPPPASAFNALVAALRLSPEDLLRNMGYNLAPPLAAKLPRSLVVALLELGPEDQASIEATARGLAQFRRMEHSQGQDAPRSP